MSEDQLAAREDRESDQVAKTTDHAGATGQTSPTNPPAAPLLSDWHVARAVWPTLVASAIGLFPSTVFSTFLVPIADAAGASEAAVGALLGLGGIGAVLVGITIAPLIGPIRPGRVAAGGLLLLALASLLGTLAWVPALAMFCLLIGTANAALVPALSVAAADRFGTGRAAARAATLVTTIRALGATLVAPLVALPALWWGWRGDLVAVAVAAVMLTPALLRYGQAAHSADAQQRIGYFAAFRALVAVPGARALLLVAFGRAGAFMGYLAFLAPFYADQFGLSPGAFAFVWTVSGGAFFLGNLIAGRLVNATGSERRAHRAMRIGLLTALLSLFGVFLAPALPVAVLATGVLSASHAVIAASVVSLLVNRCGQLRGAALSVNDSGMNLGLFLGAPAGGIGLAAGGYLGAAAVFGALTVLAMTAALTLRCSD